MGLLAAPRALGALGVCAALGICTLYMTKSAAQSAKPDAPQAGADASPIYGITIPAGFRDWRVIAVGHLSGGDR